MKKKAFVGLAVVLALLSGDYKVEKIVVGPMLSSADKGPLAQFNFDYDVVQFELPEILPAV